MKPITLITLTLFTAAPVFAADKQVSGKTYTFTVPNDVTVQPPGDSDIYSFQWSSGLTPAIHVLNITRHAPSPETLKLQADTMQQELEKQFEKGGKFTDIKKNRSELKVGTFNGIELEFIITHRSGIKLQQHWFFLSNGTHTLQGQLIGSSQKDRDKAWTIMKSVKKRVLKKVKPVQEPRPTSQPSKVKGLKS